MIQMYFGRVFFTRTCTRISLELCMLDFSCVCAEQVLVAPAVGAMT